jgi:UDP-2-acetamido-2-deoxy-ribo-hexuluronate aminotransferase
MLGHAGAIVEDRRATARRYRDASPSWRGVRHVAAPAGLEENGYLCVLECAPDAPAALAAAFAARGIATARTYPSTMDQQPPAAGRFVAASDLSRSHAFARRALNLPLYYGLPAAHQARVLAAAAELFA